VDAHTYTKPNQTRPDRRSGSGSGPRGAGRPGPADAGRPPAHGVRVFTDADAPDHFTDATVDDLLVCINEYMDSEGHVEVWVAPVLDGSGELPYPDDPELVDAARARHLARFQRAVRIIDLQGVKQRHRCGPREVCSISCRDDLDDPCLTLTVPTEVRTDWRSALRKHLLRDIEQNG